MANDDSTFLAGLADSLCEVVAGDPFSLLVHVKKAGDDYDVGTLDLQGRPPADVLLGFVAPDEWFALGFAGRGRPRHLDTGSRKGLPASASSVVLVRRDGEVVGRLRMGDVSDDTAPAYGLTLDGLQRALGLSAAAPLDTTGPRFASAWLDLVARMARAGPSPLTWAEVAALHPAAAILDDWAGEGEDLVAATTALERVCDWERLRWLTVEGSWQEPSVTPSDAAWFDAGSFSRWVMTFVPPINVLLADVRRAAGPGIARRCRSVLHQLRLQRGDRSAA
ncbi:MAG: hypothetical protein ACRD2W_09710 [Acidimicrobiales bacterium]